MRNSKLLQRRAVMYLPVLCLLASAATYGQQVLQPADLVAESEAPEIRRYSVELIIFEYNDSNPNDSELFLPDELPPEEELLLELEPLANGEIFGDSTIETQDEESISPPFTAQELILSEIPSFQQIGLRVMQPDEYTLDETYEKLVELGAYTPLMRTAWIQQTVPEEDTRPIKLRRLGDPPLKLDGNVTLYLGRYLHLVLDLELEERAPVGTYGDNRSQNAYEYDPYAIAGPRRIGPVYYRILEDRIVRNGELRYYDHPKFGAIARITRVEDTR